MSAAALRYEYVPPRAESRVDHVGTYKRTLPVSLERMYENALDWEHLPHLHASSFAAIECLDSGGWGWRARVTNGKGQDSVLELSLDRSCRRWITRNLEGPSIGAEIWTHVFVTAPHAMDLVIDFFVPGVPAEAREKVGLAYARAYERLYDEDVWMMTERQRQLDQRLDSVRDEDAVVIAPPDTDDLPHAVNLSGRAFFLHRHNDAWVIYPTTCPHQLGPLTGAIDANGEIECPWHGYRFDVVSGACVTGAACRFGSVPLVEETADGLKIAWPQA